MAVKTQDRHPAIAVKEACLAKSGVYEYAHSELCDGGYEPTPYKPVYTMYRPKDVLIKAKDRFAFTAITREHTAEQTNETNFGKQASGIVGENIEVRQMKDGEIGLFGKMVFYTRDAYDYYLHGAKETSADYLSVYKPDPTGKYDFVLTDIPSVNGVVITSRGRGGPECRVLDSAKKSLGFLGGLEMTKGRGVLGFLGIGTKKRKDARFKISALVLDGVRKLDSLDAAGKEQMVAGIMEYVNDLYPRDQKDALISTIKDALTEPAVVLENSDKVAPLLDGLYAACVNLDDEEDKKLADSVMKDAFPPKDENDGKKADGDGDKDDEKKKKEEEKKTKDSPVDISALVDAAVEKALTSTKDSIAGMIDASVKKALGLPAEDGKKKEEGADGKLQDSVLDDITREEGAFLLRSTFGR